MTNFDGMEFNFVNALRDGWSENVEIFLANKSPTHVDIVSAFQMHTYTMDEAEREGLPRPASIKLSKKTARRLLDALWTAGLRPSGEVESVGQLAAIQAHLADMRQIAFKTLNVDKP